MRRPKPALMIVCPRCGARYANPGGGRGPLALPGLR